MKDIFLGLLPNHEKLDVSPSVWIFRTRDYQHVYLRLTDIEFQTLVVMGVLENGASAVRNSHSNSKEDILGWIDKTCLSH